MPLILNLRRLIALGAVVSGICLAGCDNEDPIRVYSAGKDPRPAPQAKPIDWTLPPGWNRVLSLSQDGLGGYAKIQVTPDDPTPLVLDVRVLQGQGAGDLLANLNRWERQLSLPITPQESAAAKSKTIQVEGHEAHRVDLTGADDKKSPQEILAVIVPEGSRAWTFTLKGPPEKLAPHVETFDAFISSIRFPTHSHGDEVATSQPAGPTTPEAPAAVAKSNTIKNFTLPPGWQQDSEKKTMRFATFFLGSGPDRTEIIVTQLAAGGFGDMLGNINRWRREVKLEELKDAVGQASREISVGGHPAQYYEFDGPADARSSSVTMVTLGAQTWFLKLIGPAKTVAEQRANFVEFLKTIQFGEAGE